ncbi:MAG: stage II sporulation protein M [Planctomycetes bacterium]|nr:stage II sporulation protein M [Planctomycetota bacterium]
MKESEFIKKNSVFWRKLKKELKRSGPLTCRDTFPDDYEKVCYQIGLSRQRGYNLELIDSLDSLALRMRQELYRKPSLSLHNLLYQFLVETPRVIRGNFSYVLAALFLFTLPAIATYFILLKQPHLAFVLIDPANIEHIEDMYRDNAPHLGAPADVDSRVMMFGYYIKNNIGIDFSCFAGGILVGIGSIFFLVFNGFFLGTIFGHLENQGLGYNLSLFVVSHAPMELMALVFSGAAGMKMGFSFLIPGPYTRLHSLRKSSLIGVKFLILAAIMTFVAAAIEAYWSSLPHLDMQSRVIFSLSNVLLIGAYVGLLGWKRGPI